MWKRRVAGIMQWYGTGKPIWNKSLKKIKYNEGIFANNVEYLTL